MKRLLAYRRRFQKYEPFAFFIAGFLVDVLTLRRIDSWLKLSSQILFFLVLGGLLVLRQEGQEEPEKKSVVDRVRRNQTRIIHFLFGNLLSSYVVFYFKSASASGRSFYFLLFLVLVMILNEVPRFRRLGLRLQITLYGFCLSSFLIYLFPILVGRMGTDLFLAAVTLACTWTLTLTYFVVRNETDPLKASIPYSGSVILMQILLVVSYMLKIIPPVPLSVNYAGIFHKVERQGGKYLLSSVQPWYDFWSNGEKIFYSRESEPVYCFVRIFAPVRFSQKIVLHWLLYDEKARAFQSQDRIGIVISGGRESGFRGFAFKSNYQNGRWKVNIETEDERVIGVIQFKIEPDPDRLPRDYKIEEG